MHRSRSLLPRVLPRVLAAGLAAVLALGAFASADSAAAAPTPTPTPSPTSSTTLVYQVHTTSYSIDPSGAHIDNLSSDGPISVDCSSKPCTLAAFAVGGLKVTVPGTSHLIIPGSGDVCTSDFEGVVTLVIAIGTKFTGTYDRTGEGETTCSNG